MTKPAYRLPSMKQIASVKWNGRNVVSTFAGCGGSCLGYRWAGYRVLWANEFIPAAAETYKANFPTTILDARDIREISGADVQEATGLNVGEIDILDGSPPCAGFSTAGKIAKAWGEVRKYSDTEQRVDDLFDEYLRLVEELQPRVFVAENVSGLTKGASVGVGRDILRKMRSIGYDAKAKVLDAQWLGVPQARARLIFCGVRKDPTSAAPSPVFPTPLSYRYSVRDAIGRAVRTKSYHSNNWTSGDRPACTITASGQYFTAEERFSIAELKQICGFPADFVLTGTPEQQWERLGRAVPPPMMRAVASRIAQDVFRSGRAA